MKKRFIPLLIVFSLALGASVQTAFTFSDGWELIADGIAYQEFRLAGPNRVFVARLDQRNPNAIIDSSIAQGKLSGGTETVSGMAERYDGAINAWGGSWGNRNRVVVAINGSFYDPKTGVPQDGLIHSGWYASRFGDMGGGSGFAWTLDRHAFIGGCVRHPSAQQILTIRYNRMTRRINGINVPPDEHEMVIFTPQFDRDSQQDDSGVEVLVEMLQPPGIQPPPAMTKGIVREIRDGEGSIPIPFDHIVLSARGRSRIALLENLHPGDFVGISHELSHFKKDCRAPNTESWTGTYASIGGSFLFLKDGVIQEIDAAGANARHPRTAICLNKRYTFFIVVDGRQNDYSIGMSMPELGEFCKHRLDATWGINQDGGGSSTMWIRGEIVNFPSDGSERLVANGLMMIAVEPIERSLTFETNDQVIARTATYVRLGPGTNYAAISSIPEDTPGTIQYQRSGLNGVLAKGTYWWHVDFGEVSGWVDENTLNLTLRPEEVDVWQTLLQSLFGDAIPVPNNSNPSDSP
jgi:uncharacterized protein YraI